MRSPLVLLLVLVLDGGSIFSAEPDFPLTEDSKPHAEVPKGELIRGSITAKEGSVFPGTKRDYTIYLPPRSGDKSVPAPFMVFQDGVIYQAPTVFDNLIARKEIPPLIGIFIKPGVVPAANENALPRYNRSYEYDSVSDTYARFLIDEFLPAIEAKHGLKLSTDPNDAAISGNSSGGICAFMVAWHRPDRFRRVFTGVGTYVGIHGADQLPVLVRKMEPKPIKVFLQSGTGDNNLYCGDWWMANQTMERALTWAGYDVNHAWGEGGHNQKHASQIFPEVLRWLWKDFATAKEIKANPRGESKWKGYEVVGDGEWDSISLPDRDKDSSAYQARQLAPTKDGTLLVLGHNANRVWSINSEGAWTTLPIAPHAARRRFALKMTTSDELATLTDGAEGFRWLRKWSIKGANDHVPSSRAGMMNTFVCLNSGKIVAAFESEGSIDPFGEPDPFSPPNTGPYLSLWSENERGFPDQVASLRDNSIQALCVSPDQTIIYAVCRNSDTIHSIKLGKVEHHDPFAEPKMVDGLIHAQPFGKLEQDALRRVDARGLCVDTHGWLYVATALGIQVCDQAGRVNFIIPTPQPPHDVCFGGKDLSSLFIACGDKIYQRQTKARGIVSSQQPPIKPAPPKL